MDDTISTQTRVCEVFVQKNTVLTRAPRQMSDTQKRAKDEIKMQQNALDVLVLIDKEVRANVNSKQDKKTQTYLVKGIATEHLLIPHTSGEYRFLMRGLHSRIISALDSRTKRRK